MSENKKHDQPKFKLITATVAEFDQSINNKK